MIKRLFITKRYSNYADTFFLLGLAHLAEYALKATKQKSAIHLIDKGTAYILQFKKPINLEAIAKLTYSDPFPPVKGQKTDTSKIPAEITPFDTVEQTQTRKVYRDFLFNNRGKIETVEETPKPPDSRTQNGVILTQMRCDRNHNDLWRSWELRDNYDALLAALFQGFSQENTTIQQVAALFHQATGCKLPSMGSAVADVNSRVVLFSKQGIDLMTRNLTSTFRQSDQDWKLTEITENPGFLNIAKAINSATLRD